MHGALLLILTVLFAAHASVASAQSPATAGGSPPPRMTLAEAMKRAVALEAARQATPAQSSPQTGNWCSRHPIACGSLIGLGAGFVVGVATNGDQDYAASANGLIYAAVGAGIGAAAGGVIVSIR